MTDIYHITRKTDKQFLFEVQLNWLEQSCGTLHARDVNAGLLVATSPKLGGQGNDWSPEHLFLSSISSCYMSTMLQYAKKYNLQIVDFDCNAIGQIELVERKYKFTHINLYPIISVADERMREKANLVIERTQHNCLVSNSVNTAIIYHSKVLLKSQPLKDNQTINNNNADLLLTKKNSKTR